MSGGVSPEVNSTPFAAPEGAANAIEPMRLLRLVDLDGAVSTSRRPRPSSPMKSSAGSVPRISSFSPIAWKRRMARHRRAVRNSWGPAISQTNARSLRFLPGPLPMCPRTTRADSGRRSRCASTIGSTMRRSASSVCRIHRGAIRSERATTASRSSSSSVVCPPGSTMSLPFTGPEAAWPAFCLPIN